MNKRFYFVVNSIPPSVNAQF